TSNVLIQCFISALNQVFALKDLGALNFFLASKFPDPYSDAGWLSDSDDSRPQYGYAIFHGSNLISWTSRKQRVVARSSTEAEYRVLAYNVAKLLWLKQLLSDLQVPLQASPMLLCDNVGVLKIGHVSSHDQLADIFTKTLSRDRVAVLRSKLQVCPNHELAGGDNS
ncbi:hypothetical protein V2J09_016247, partial [Rumex salicifolius]